MERQGFLNRFLVNTFLASFRAKLQITYFPKCWYTDIKYIHGYYLLHIFMAAEIQRGKAGGA